MSPALLALIALSVAPPPPLPESVYSLPPADLLEQARHDAQDLIRYDDGLDRLEGQMRQHPELFTVPAGVNLSPDQKAILLGAWGTFFEYTVACEVLRQRYWGFVKEPPTSERHALGFVLTHAALTIELAHGLAFADLTEKNAQVATLLNEPSVGFGVPPRAYDEMRGRVIHVATTTQLVTGDAYGEFLLPVLGKLKQLEAPPFKSLAARMRAHSGLARERLVHRGVPLFTGTATDFVKEGTAQGLLPYQTAIAEWLSHTRVKRVGKPLIQRTQAEELVKRLEPGDILVARQNWFLSNVGLPGFWPHAELYLSSPPELAAYFDSDPEVSAYVAALPKGAPTFSAYLKSRFPEKWRAYNGHDFRGEPIRVMEAISEGVSFTGIGHAMLVDYLGAMRPRLSKRDKALALIRAFEYQGRPYDFEFDFYSDAALVCSELVYKSYAPSAQTQGLKLSLVEMVGRMTLPPTEFVKLFDSEFGKPDRQLDFVGFLDGREASASAVFADAEALRQSWKRAKWDVLQK